MATYRHQLILDLAGNLAQQAQRFGRSFNALSADTQRSLWTMQRATMAAGRGLEGMGGRYAALITGAAGAGAIRSVAMLERRFTRLGVQANITAEETKKLQKEIFDTAQMPGVRIDPSDLTSAIEQIVEKSGDLQFARDNIHNIALAIQAAGAGGAEVGAVTSEFRKLGIVAQNDVLQTMDMLVEQGKAGAFTFANFAASGERLVSMYGATGRAGKEAARELGAVMQVIRQGTGSSEQAVTAFESIIRTLFDSDKQKMLRDVAGIAVIDPLTKQMRSLPQLLEEIVTKSGGDLTKMGAVFDAEGVRGLTAAALEFKRTGAVTSFRQFLDVVSTGNALMADSQRIANDAVGAYTNLATAFKQFADTNIEKPLERIAGALNSLDPGHIQAIMSALALSGGALVALMAAAKVKTAVGTLFGGGGRGGPGAGAAGAAAGMAVVNVRVINWPGTFGGGMGGLQRGGPATTRRGLGNLGRAGGILGMLLGTAQLAQIAADSTTTLRQKASGAANVAGSIAGGLAGAKVGALAGALGGPLAPVTVPAGALIGGTAGYLLGGDLADRLARAVMGNDRNDQAGNLWSQGDNKLEISVNVGGLGRGGSVEVGNAPSAAAVDVSAGYLFLGP